MATIATRRTQSYKALGELNRKLFGDGLGMDFSKHECWSVHLAGKLIAFATYKAVGGDTVFLSRAGVLPEARGQGLQKKLIKARCNHAKKAGYSWAVTYTSPENAPSFTSLQACGFLLYLPEYRWAGTEMLYWRKKL